jgi:ketosteroid isomerase-like protein
MSEQDNVQIVQQLYAAFSQGDLAAALETLSEEVEWQEPGPAEILPWAGTFRGREQVAQLMRRFSTVATVEQFGIQETIAQGDKVVVVETQRAYAKASGRPLRDDAIRVFTLRDGKIVKASAYEDTALLVAAMRGD